MAFLEQAANRVEADKRNERDVVLFAVNCQLRAREDEIGAARDTKVATAIADEHPERRRGSGGDKYALAQRGAAKGAARRRETKLQRFVRTLREPRRPYLIHEDCFAPQEMDDHLLDSFAHHPKGYP